MKHKQGKKTVDHQQGKNTVRHHQGKEILLHTSRERRPVFAPAGKEDTVELYLGV